MQSTATTRQLSIKSRIELFETSAATPLKKLVPLQDRTNVVTISKSQRSSEQTWQDVKKNLRRTVAKDYEINDEKKEQSLKSQTSQGNFVQVRKQLFEAIGTQNKTQNQVLRWNQPQPARDGNTFMTRAFQVLTFSTCTDNDDNFLCFDGLDDAPVSSMFRVRRTQSYIWTRIWQTLYAMLAALELLAFVQRHYHLDKSCQRFPMIDSMLGPIEVHSCSFQDDKIGFGMDVVLSVLTSLNVPTWWNHVINTLFIVAIFIQAVLSSWTYASKGNQDKQEKEDALTMKGSDLVTRRTKGRNVRLETMSTNRHFIARWTNNRIRWSQATTEILRFAFVVLLVRMLFVPVLTKNPFTKHFGQTTLKRGLWGKKKPFHETPTDQLISVAEAIFSIFHSTAVTKFRQQCKAFTVKLVKTLLRQPWKASGRVQLIFKAIRWAKFLAPLIGTCNKLRGHCTDYQKKRLQRQRSKNAAKAWKNLVVGVRRGLTMDQAASILQKRYRAKNGRFHATQLNLMIPIGQPQQPIHLLLRPNTDFAVNWKRITITCVLFEIAQLLLAPQLAPNASKVPAEDLVKMALTPNLGSLKSFPWLEVYMVAIQWISIGIAEMVSAVSFFDVIITFFTGELDTAGLLIPQDFFPRWILPGVVLQLIVNPTMKDLAQVVGRCIKFAQRVGPMRAFHILVAILPIIQAVFHTILDTVFIFVYKQNRRDMRKGKKRVARTHGK